MFRSRLPWREFRFRFGIQLIGAVFGVVIVLTVFPSVSSGRVHIPYWVWILVAAAVLLLSVAASAVGLLVGKRLVGDRIEVALREPGRKWRHGRVTVDGSGVTFEGYRLQMRIPSGKKQHIDDVALGPDTGRRPPLRQVWTINPQLHIVTLASTEGHYELGALPSRIEELRERLHIDPVPDEATKTELKSELDRPR